MDKMHKMTRILTSLALLLAALISVGIPAGYYLLGYQNQRAVVETEAYMNSIFLSQAIGESPDYWRFEEQRLAEILTHHSSRKFKELRSIVDSDNEVVTRAGEAVAPPLLTVSSNLYDSGRVAGRIEISSSLRPLLVRTAVVAAIALILGLAIYSALKLFPLRALSDAMALAYEEKERALALLNNIPDIAWLKDRDDRYVAANGPFGRMCGIHPRDLPGKTDLELWPVDLAQRYRADDREVMETGKPKQMEEPIVDTAGRMTWILTIKTPIFDARGEVIGTTGIARDFTERKRMEDELRESRQYLLDIIQFYPDATMVIDREKRVVAWNRAMEELTGVGAEEMLGKGDYEYSLPFYGERRPILIDLAMQPLTGIDEKYVRIERHGSTLYGESYIHNAQGEVVYFHGTAAVLRNTRGEVIGAIESIRDISERKKTEELLAEKERFVSGIFDSIQDGITVLDPKLNILRVNSVLERDFLNGETLTGKKCHEVYFSRLEPCTGCPSMVTLRSGEPSSVIFSVPGVENHVWLELFSYPLFDSNRSRVTGVIEVARDISARKLAEEALQEKEEKLSTITTTAQDAIIMIDAGGRISFWNPAAEAIFGYCASEVQGRELHSLIAPRKYHDEYRHGFALFRETGRGVAVGKTLELDAIRKGGEEFPVELSLSAIQLRGEWHAVGILRDITARKRAAEETLQRGILVERLNSALVALAQDNKIYGGDMNAAFRAITESSSRALEVARASIWFYTEGNRGIRCMDLYDAGQNAHAEGIQLEASAYPAYFSELQKECIIVADDAVVDSSTSEFAESYLQPLGITSMLDVPIRVAGRVIGVVCHEHVGEPRSWDVEEQSFATAIAGFTSMSIEIHGRMVAEERIRQLNAELELKVEERTRQLLDAQEELVRREKLAILGQLSGSVGHELRNPLGVMSNAVYFLKMVLTGADDTTKEYLDMIKHEIDNSQRIITDLLDFARTKTPQIQTVTARELLDGTVGKCIIPNNVTLRIDLADPLPPLRIDPLQVGQVFQNLVTNAVQAMPAGGTLRIGARLKNRSEEQKNRNEERGTGSEEKQNLEPRSSDLEPASFLEPAFMELSVTDTGEGISVENMKKLFQPLFTTKAKGIGLGLVVCRNLVEANGGRIEVESEEGKGTTFTVFLPVAEERV